MPPALSDKLAWADPWHHWGPGSSLNHTPQNKSGGAREGGHQRLQDLAWERTPSLLFLAKQESIAICSKLARSPSALGPGRASAFPGR